MNNNSFKREQEKKGKGRRQNIEKMDEKINSNTHCSFNLQTQTK
jgi:hypothetical protein